MAEVALLGAGERADPPTGAGSELRYCGRLPVHYFMCLFTSLVISNMLT